MSAFLKLPHTESNLTQTTKDTAEIGPSHAACSLSDANIVVHTFGPLLTFKHRTHDDLLRQTKSLYFYINTVQKIPVDL